MKALIIIGGLVVCLFIFVGVWFMWTFIGEALDATRQQRKMAAEDDHEALPDGTLSRSTQRRRDATMKEKDEGESNG